MEAQLDSIVRRIKSDGVESARKEAADITAQAKEEASRIIAGAEDEKQQIISKAQSEVQRLQKTVEDSLKQAARDLVLVVRKDLEGRLRKLLERDVSEVLSNEGLENIILRLMKDWSGGSAVDIQLSESDAQALTDRLLSKLKKEMSIDGNFAIKPFEEVKAGLRINFRDGTAYFDFTAEEISETLAQLLNSKFVSYLS